MRLDLVVPNEGPFALEAVRASAQFEQMGYDGLWFTDHVVGVRSFQPVYGPYWLEVLSALAYAAANTSRVRLGIGVLVLPVRDPVYTAKVLSTIDNLSDGRVDLGIGTGWAKSEFHALGRGDLHDVRGPYTDECMDVMLRCWEGGEFGYEGRWVNFRRIQFEPVPVQKPRIPIWVGSRGTARAPMRRVAKYADVWHPTGVTPDELETGGAKLDEMAGREIPRSIRTQLAADTESSKMLDHLAAYRDAGCVEAAVDLKTSSFKAMVEGAQRLIEAAQELRD